MAESNRTDRDDAAGDQSLAAQTDARLAELGREDEFAVQELRRRHRNAALTYGRICGSDDAAGDELAERALELAEQAARRGSRPHGTWRHRLLLLVQQAAVEWRSAGLRERLDPGFAAWLDGALGNAGDFWAARQLWQERNSLLLGSYYTLPQHTAGLLWHSVAEEQSDETSALAVGFAPRDVPPTIPVALEQLRKAFLTLYLKRHGDARCQGYRRLLEVVGRPHSQRHSPDLAAHVAECVCCSSVHAELIRLREEPRAALLDGLLGWGGAAYIAVAPTWGAPDPVTEPEAVPLGEDRKAVSLPYLGWLRRPVTMPSFALTAGAATAVTAVLVALLAGADPDTTDSSADAPPTVVTVTATQPPPFSPSPTTREPSPSKSEEKKSPSPTKSSPKPAPDPTKKKPPKREPSGPSPTGPPGGDFALVVNADSDLCLDIRDGTIAKRIDVITAKCSGARTQQWRLDRYGLLRSAEDDDYCLDSRGATDNGVGIWACSSVYGDNGINLLFSIDRDGTIRPLIDASHALTPASGSSGSTLGFSPANGSERQRWGGAEP